MERLDANDDPENDNLPFSSKIIILKGDFR